ncbi:hypothetical protein N4T56_16090 [Shewanella sp. KJ10-1]|uniref:Uncharacterized protein n=1 Tax=Shewanella phaeophyticola TaxID=2978345 RepID=A0ABT2P501_9GAMM|nr:hypothetical protein [Shewanella sp. KJ10-1]
MLDAGGSAESNYAYNPIACLEGTEFPLNDQIIAGIGITSLYWYFQKSYRLMPQQSRYIAYRHP